MAQFGKLLLLLAILLARTHLPLGRLPGDLLFRAKHTTLYFPLATSLLLSAGAP